MTAAVARIHPQAAEAAPISGAPGLGPIPAIVERLENADWFTETRKGLDLSPCLGLLLEALGWRGDARQIADVMPRHSHHFDLFDLTNSMAYLGYAYESQPIRFSRIQERHVPCVFVSEEAGNDKPLLVLKITEEGMLCHDTATSTSFTALPGTLREQGYILTFSPHEEHVDTVEEHAKRKTGVTWFQLLLTRFGSNMWQLFMAGVLINFAALAVPIFVMGVYNKVIGAYSLHSLKYLLLGITIAIVVECVLRYVRVYALSWFGARINHLVSTGIFQQLLYLPAIFVEHASASSQLARLKAFESVRDFFTGPMFLVLLELPFTLILLGAIALIAGPVAVIPLAAMAVMGGLLLFIMKRMKLETFRLARAASERQQLAVEGITKMHALRYSGMNAKWLERFASASAKAATAGRDSAFTASLLESLAQAIALFAVVCTIVAGVERIWAEQMTAGGLVAVMILTWRVMNPLQNLCTMLPSLQQVYNSVAQVNKLMQLKPERAPHKTALVYKPFRGRIAFHQVGLRYGRRGDPVFAGLSFDAKPGECIAITGPNGSGKSSILSLAAGLYQPQVGSIRIDGTDIRQMDPIVLRRHITFITQQPEFFSGTILENLQLPHPTVTEEQAKAALIELDAWQDIARLPDGLHTRIGNGGTSLPGRLLYRLNLARAMVAPCSIILCDELPYAVLNSTTGERFKAFLKKQRGVRTVLLVAHREDYMQIADRMVLLRPDRKPVIAKPDEILPHLRKARL